MRFGFRVRRGERRQRGEEVPDQRHGHVHGAVPDVAAKPAGVEKDPGAPGRGRRVAVARVAHERVALVGQVGADLVQAAGVEADLAEAVPAPRGAHEVGRPEDLRAGGPPLRRDDAPQEALRRHGLLQGLRKHPGAARPAVADADVALRHPARGELEPRRVVPRAARGPEDRPRGVPVQAVDEAVGGPGVACDGEAGAELLLQPVLSDRGGVSLSHPLGSCFVSSGVLSLCALRLHRCTVSVNVCRVDSGG